MLGGEIGNKQKIGNRAQNPQKKKTFQGNSSSFPFLALISSFLGLSNVSLFSSTLTLTLSLWHFHLPQILA